MIEFEISILFGKEYAIGRKLERNDIGVWCCFLLGIICSGLVSKLYSVLTTRKDEDHHFITRLVSSVSWISTYKIVFFQIFTKAHKSGSKIFIMSR